MKEGFIIGAMLGVAAGIIMYKYNKETKNAVDKGEQMLKNQLEKTKKDFTNMTATKNK